MCEFNVILNDKIQIKDIIYTKVEGNKVVVKDILGKTMEFENCRIIEVDVPNARLVLDQTRTKGES
ncbi:MAG: CooT family nickel-binding protein [Nitrososphaerota archaeon]|jgi:predicted RNA-binding protein|nr:CooT family nickel-binding protein [Nitrososphaerota archaeon]